MSELKGLSFQPPGGHLWPFLILGLLLLVFSWWVYRRNPAPMSGGLRTLLLGLRALAFLILVILICRPVLSMGASDRGRRIVAVLLDTSESLTLPAGRLAGGPTRAGELARAVEAFFDPLADRHAVRAWGFDREARPLPDEARTLLRAEALRPSGDVTATGPALESTVAEIGRSRAGAVVIVSDGVANSGLDPLAVARRLSVPVYAVAVGSDSVGRDAAVARIQVNRTAFLGDEVPMAVTVRNQGLAGLPATIRVVDVTRAGEEDVVVEQSIVWAPSGAEQDVRLRFRPDAVGQHFYEVRVSGADDEFTAINNTRLFALDVREEKNRVLVIAGSIDWDLTFLKRALEADSSLSVTTMARLGTGWRDLSRPATARSFTPDAAFFGPHVLVVLHDLAAADLPAAGWEALAAWTRRGGGLLVLGGSRGGGLTRLAGTAIAPLLPVDPATPRPNGASEIAVSLEAAGRRHPATQVFENEVENDAAWTDLPPVGSASSEPAVKGGAEVLALGTGEFPVLVAGRSGGGKILVAPAHGFWRWAFRLAGFQGRNEFHDRLWTNAARWLTAPDLASRLLVEPGRPVFERGNPVDFTARLADRDYQPVDGADIAITVSPDDSATARALAAGRRSNENEPLDRTVRLAGSGGGFYAGETGSLPPGRYRFRAEARRGGEELGDATGRFAVETMGLEFRRPAADPASLVRLAEESGGRAYTVSEAARLAEELQVTGPAGEEVVTIDIWDSPWFFAVFVGLLSTEWFLRRRRGMV